MLSLFLSRNAFLLGLVAACGVLIANGVKRHDEKVVSAAIQKIEASNAAAVTKGRRAAVRSADPRVPGTRDPTTRDD